jgi:hypothetical protein
MVNWLLIGRKGEQLFSIKDRYMTFETKVHITNVILIFTIILNLLQIITQR